MMKQFFRPTIGMLAACFVLPACAGDHLVLQKDRSFSMNRLSVRVGDTVTFLNLDPVPHNAFSLSQSNPFDTGMLMNGESKSTTFVNPGVVEVECAVHPAMKMAIAVLR